MCQMSKRFFPPPDSRRSHSLGRPAAAVEAVDLGRGGVGRAQQQPLRRVGAVVGDGAVQDLFGHSSPGKISTLTHCSGSGAASFLAPPPDPGGLRLAFICRSDASFLSTSHSLNPDS